MGSTPSAPPQATPAAAPAPAPAAPVAPVVNGAVANNENLMAANSAGSNGFRIDKASSAVTGGSGLNIPTAAA